MPLLIGLWLFVIRLPGFILTSALLLFIPCGAAQQPAPDALERHYSAAQTFQLAGDLEHAETEYHEVLALALQRLGNLAAAEVSDSEEAAHLLEEAVEVQPENVEARVDLATVYFRQ